MKLAEAILERDGLKKRLGVLEARLVADSAVGKPLAHLQNELQSVATQIRDLSIAISWTESQATLLGLPLLAYRIRIENWERLIEIWEKTNREKADALWASLHNDHRVLQAATWLIDLEVPIKLNSETPGKTKEEK